MPPLPPPAYTWAPRPGRHIVSLSGENVLQSHKAFTRDLRHVRKGDVEDEEIIYSNACGNAL